MMCREYLLDPGTLYPSLNLRLSFTSQCKTHWILVPEWCNNVNVDIDDMCTRSHASTCLPLAAVVCSVDIFTEVHYLFLPCPKKNIAASLMLLCTNLTRKPSYSCCCWSLHFLKTCQTVSRQTLWLYFSVVNLTHFHQQSLSKSLLICSRREVLQ